MSNGSQFVPKSIKLAGANDKVTVQWSDGRAFLGNWVTNERAELVGRYAMQIYWNDQHSSGIYSFDYLRQICPCPECAAKREGAAGNM